MTDFFDAASEREDRDRELAIEHHRKTTSSLLPVGYCHWCDSPVKASQLFCDTECREDWESEQRMKRIGGVN